MSRSEFDYLFTVFTATYNRAKTLHRVYESLVAQTFRDFEWLVVDDGSEDDTKSLIEKWQDYADFPIRYIYQENQGQHVAYNRGIEAALGKLFLQFDSDDACVPNALARFKYHWDTIPEEQRDEFSGVWSLCNDQHGGLVGNKFPQDVTDLDYMSCFYKLKVHGEKWALIRTDVLREFPYPTPEYKYYVHQSIVSSRIARKYKTRFVNEQLRIYYIGHESISNPSNLRSHATARSCHLVNSVTLNEQMDYLLYAPLKFLRAAVHYTRFSLYLGQTPMQQFQSLNNLAAKGLWLAAFPLGFILYAKDRLATSSNIANGQSPAL